MSCLRRKAFVLRIQEYGEQRALLELLTAEDGLITVALSSKQLQNLACQIYSFSEFELFYYKQRYRLDQATVIQAYAALRHDLERLTCLAHLVEILRDLLPDAEADPAYYKFWAFTEHAIAEADDPYLLTFVAQYRLLAIAGFAPWLQNCSRCGRDYNARSLFSFRDRALYCAESCHPPAGDRCLLLSPGLRAALLHFSFEPLERLYNFQMNPTVQADFIQFSQDYLQEVLGKAYHRLDMIRDLRHFCPDSSRK